MSLSREQRTELDTLSKLVFGSASRWRKLVENGVTEMITEEKTETVPGEKEGDAPTERKVQVPVKAPNGAVQYRVKRFSEEEILQFMRDRKALIDQINEMNRKNREKQELTKKVHEELKGSAV